MLSESSRKDQPRGTLAPAELIAVTLYQHQGPPDPVPSTVPVGQERIEILLSGRGWVREGDQGWSETTPGDLWWHTEGEETIGRSDPAQPYACLNLMFTVDPNNAWTHPEAGTALPIAHRSRWNDLEDLHRFTAEAVAAFLDPGVERRPLLRYIHARIAIEALRPKGGSRGERSALVRRAVRWLEENHGNKVRVPALARLLGCSAAHLHARFRDELGMTPHEKLMEIRMRNARERLALTLDPIKQIAADCGFSRPAAFCHAFKRHTGTPPGRFRDRQRSLYLGT